MIGIMIDKGRCWLLKILPLYRTFLYVIIQGTALGGTPSWPRCMLQRHEANLNPFVQPGGDAPEHRDEWPS